ncbi:MAG: hypothetical protein ACHQIM_22450 [Sphingobacteriales bacterium]
MKQKEVFKKIGDIIKELSDQYEYLKTVPDDLNDLELELFVSNAHFLTDHIEILSKLNLQNVRIKKAPAEKKETAYEHKYFEPVVQQMKPAAGITGEKLEKPAAKPVEMVFTKEDDKQEQPVVQGNQETEKPVNAEPETIRHELILDDSQNWDDDEILPDEDENIPDENEALRKAEKRKPGNSVVSEANNEVTAAPADDISRPEVPPKAAEEELLTINEKISSQLGDKGIARTEQLSVKPISDIKLAITLNDKLLYVKDLFNGYNLAYSEAIEILNRFNTFEEAMRFLKTNYITKNNWDSKPATTEKFYALLKRRYA